MPDTPADTRARILLRLGGRSDAVVGAVEAAGASGSEAQTIVARQLEALRANAGVLLAFGVVIACCALIANIAALSDYMGLRRSHGYHMVFFYPLPLLVGVVLASAGVRRLIQLR